MKDKNAEHGIRRSIGIALTGVLVTTTLLAWFFSRKPVALTPPGPAVASTTQLALVRPKASLRLANQAITEPAPDIPERPLWTGATRLSGQEIGTEATELAANQPAVSLGPVQFDYRAQGAQVADVVRSAIAHFSNLDETSLAGSFSPFSQYPGAVGLFNPAPSRPSTPLPQPNTAPDQTAGLPSSPAPQASPGSGAPSAQAVNNAVEAYREGERMRRAYVEEMRLRRITTIAEARQQNGF